MSIVNGVVEGTSEKFGKFSVLLNGTWYATKAEWAPSPKPNKGDEVQFDNGGAKFIKGLKILGAGDSSSVTPPSSSSSSPRPAFGGGGGRSFPVGALAPERTINRQNALTAAVNYANCVSDSFTPQEIIATARLFESYTTGDLDLENAQAAIESAI